VVNQASLPNPRTWAAADLVTVPRLRADVTNAVAFLSQRPYFIGQCSTGPSTASATDTPLPLDTELTDAWNAHVGPPAATPGAFWGPVPGWYLVDVRAPFAFTSTTAAPFMAGVQGVAGGSAFGPVHGALTVNGSGSQTIVPRCVDLVSQLQTGAPNASTDYIQPTARQDSGGSVSLQNLAYDMPAVSIRWVCSATGSAPIAVPPLTAVPTPITAAWLNANVRDTIKFLIFPPVCKAVATSGSVANSSLASPQGISPASVTFDNWAGFSAGKYTAPVAGRYLVAGQVNFASSSTTAMYACGVTAGGVTYWGGAVRFTGSSLAGGASVTKRVRLTAGQTVQLVAAQSTGGSLSLNGTAANQTRLIVVWEGI
jgi:hypothetical protein